MSRGKQIQFTTAQLSEIKDMYLEGQSARRIAKYFNCTHTVITKRVKELGIKRTKQEAIKTSRKQCDRHFFDVIDTEAKAYWLGFLYADGNVTDGSQPSLQVCLSQRDVKHLELFNSTLKSEYSVGRYHYTNPVCQLRIPCQDLVNALIDKGCGPRKTLTVKPPTLEQVPQHLIRHFVRGVIDGDGCFTKHHQLVMLGTQEFVQWFSEQIPFNHKASVRPNKSIYRVGISYRTFEKCQLLFDYLYQDATVWLPRKYDKICASLAFTKVWTIPSS